MEPVEIVILVVVLLLLVAVAAYVMAQSRKRKQLRSTFGPEYDRTVESTGRRRDAERELAEREERRRSLDIRPLPEADRRAFADRWRRTQADFVDDPETAVRQADVLVTEVMAQRGYPVGDFEQMSRDVSVDHASVVEEYRAAHDISERNDRKQATTEQLRQAMVHYRALFDDLLSTSETDDRDDDGAYRQEVVHREETVYRDDTVHRDDTAGRDDAAYRDEPTNGGYADDDDRRSFDPVDTRRADGVRVERGGLERGRGDTGFEHDLPRDDRPRA